MRAPLSWLRDFAPFPDDIEELRAALDDLGLVVEAIEHVGEGLGDVVVSRVIEIRPIEGADRSAWSSSTPGAEPLEIVCGAHNFAVGDRVPLAPVGAILPGGFEIARRQMRGVVSNGMLCSGEELGLSDDGAGLLVLGDEAPGAPGTPLMEALGLEPDVVFDITVEGNRPDAWSITGIARDLAGRLGLPFTAPEPPAPRAERPAGRGGGDRLGGVTRPLPPPDGDGAATDVTVGPSPRWIARAAAAGRHAPHQQRRRRLQLRDARARASPPTPTTWRACPAAGSACAGPGPGETVVDPRRGGAHGWGCGAGASATPARTASSATPRARRWASAASWAARRRRSPATTTEVLLEAAYFTPMAIARTVQAPGPAHGGVGPLRAGLRPLGDRAVGAALLPAAGRERARARAWPTACSTSGARSPSPSWSRCPSPGCTARSASALGRRGDRPPDRAASASRSSSAAGDDGGLDGRRADEPARRAARALRGRRRHRGDRPDVRLLQRAAPRPDVAPARSADRAAASRGARSRTSWRDSARRRGGRTRSSRRRRTPTSA